MKRIIDYAIVSGPDSAKVAHDVNELIKQGFQPLGGLAAAPAPASVHGEVCHLFQAMVKYLPELAEMHSSMVPPLAIKP